MQPLEIFLLLFFIVFAVGAALYFLNKWAATRMGDQQELIEKTRQVVNIYVIDKKKDKITNVKLPKAATDQMPKMAKFMKMYFVQAKVGAQITTLMCDKKAFNALPVKKNIKVGLAGIYIADIPGMKSEKEIKAQKKEKKKKAKKEKA